MKRPKGWSASAGAPIFAAISPIGRRRAARAISMSLSIAPLRSPGRPFSKRRLSGAILSPGAFGKGRVGPRPNRIGGLRLSCNESAAKLPRADPSRKCPRLPKNPGKSDDPLRPDDRDDERRDQGRQGAQARFRRGREPAGLDEGHGRLREPRRPAGGEDPLRGTVEG